MLKSSTTRLAILTLILLLGATSRILHIGDQSLWTDEGFAWYHATSPDLVASLKLDTHPPLYFAALSLWIRATGESEVALRFFSVLPSMMSMALVYQLAKEFVRARRKRGSGTPNGASPPNTMNVPAQSIVLVATLAALMMALADAENYLSQEVRHYTWHVLFAIGSMYFFLRWLRTSKQRGWLYWVGFTTALVYTHYIGAFTGIVEGIYALIFLRGKTRRQAVGGLVLSAGLLSPWLVLVGRYQIGNRGANWSFQLDWWFISDMVIKWFSQQWPLMIGLAILGTVTLVYTLTPNMSPTDNNIGKFQSPPPIPIAPLRLAERGRNAWGFGVEWRPVAPSVLLALWLFVPVVLTIIGNYFIPLLSIHRMSQITPSVVLLVALGLANFRPAMRGFLVAVILVYSVITTDFYRPKEPWRQVAQEVSQWAVPGDLVLSDIDGGDYQLLYYYHRQLPAGVMVRSLKLWRDFEPETYNTLGGLINQYKTIWIMHWAADEQAFGWFDKLGRVRTATITIDWLGNPLTSYRYDLMPDTPVASYQNGMTLRQVAIRPDSLRVDLWWSASAESPALKDDYKTSAFLLDETGKLVMQCDSLPFLGDRSTTGWQAGEVVYDPKVLMLPGEQHDDTSCHATGAALPPGNYSVGVQLYKPADGVKVHTTDGQPWATVGTITIQ